MIGGIEVHTLYFAYTLNNCPAILPVKNCRKCGKEVDWIFSCDHTNEVSLNVKDLHYELKQINKHTTFIMYLSSKIV